ncbi:tetratricopeptide repeat-containing sensor histidine kinase [Kordia sp.]|uniref:tetratricopeptide repeat-containing sensor histidine kinase n=1 Tax=Kordia sp. TaxID=1965332 RepID=UPI003D6A5050
MRNQRWETVFLTAKKADSLATVNNYTKGIAKSLRIQSYYWNYKNNLDSAFHVLQKSEKLEHKIKNYIGLLAVYNTKALLYKRNELFDEALEVYQKALTIQDSSITNKQLSKTHSNLANVYAKKSVYDSAVYHYNQSLLLNKKDTLTKLTMRTYINLANVYSLSSDYNLAEFYYKKAFKYHQSVGNEVEIAKLYNNLGALFYEKGEDELSLDYLEKSIQLREKLLDSSRLVESYINVAELLSVRNPETAFEYLDKALQYITPDMKTSLLAKIHLSKASMYREANQNAKAKAEFERAIKLSEDQEKLTFEKYLTKMKAEIAYDERNFQKAYQYRIAYEKLSDSVFNEEKLWDLSALQKSYQAKAKKAEVSLLEKDNALAEEKALRKQQENEKLYAFLIAFGVVVLLVSIIAFYFYKLKKTTSQLARQQELLLEERIHNLVNDQEIQIINASLEAREKEKASISKELHNNIGSLLTSVNFHFQAFDEKVMTAHKGTKKLYDKTLQIIQTITHEIRSISHRFDQDPIPEFNLKTAITNFSDKVANEQLKVHTAIHGLENFKNSQTSIFIFRILQELVNNTIKHANAKTLTIYITKNIEAINIMVEDDGKGFDATQLANGIGLKNLRKEIQIRNGNCDIDSNSTRGTTVNIDIPI